MKRIDENFIKKMSLLKKEPKWMLNFRLKSFRAFNALEKPMFGPNLDFDFEKIKYYKEDMLSPKDSWTDVDRKHYETFNKLGVIKGEVEYFQGVVNQVDSSVIYSKNKADDVLFMSTDEALLKHADIFKKYFSTLVRFDENKFTALNGAFWSGGSFIYVPKNTKLDRPLQSYFRIEEKNLGQFERTLIIIDDNSEVDYIEGCSAKSFASNSIHAGVVEIFVGKNSKCRYMTIQNWSKDVYNLVTKRAIVSDGAVMEWIDGNIGSRVTMKYPTCILKGNNSVGLSTSVAYAKEGQEIDAGVKMIHLGKNTKSNILSKSISEGGGISNYRGLVKITENAENSIAKVNCENIILDKYSKSLAYPTNIVENDNSYIEHEASVSKLNEEKIFYLKTKGLSEEEVKEILIKGFLEEFRDKLPLEYSVELDRLLK